MTCIHWLPPFSYCWIMYSPCTVNFWWKRSNIFSQSRDTVDYGPPIIFLIYWVHGKFHNQPSMFKFKTFQDSNCGQLSRQLNLSRCSHLLTTQSPEHLWKGRERSGRYLDKETLLWIITMCLCNMLGRCEGVHQQMAAHWGIFLCNVQRGLQTSGFQVEEGEFFR